MSDDKCLWEPGKTYKTTLAGVTAKIDSVGKDFIIGYRSDQFAGHARWNPISGELIHPGYNADGVLRAADLTFELAEKSKPTPAADSPQPWVREQRLRQAIRRVITEVDNTCQERWIGDPGVKAYHVPAGEDLGRMRRLAIAAISLAEVVQADNLLEDR